MNCTKIEMYKNRTKNNCTKIEAKRKITKIGKFLIHKILKNY